MVNGTEKETHVRGDREVGSKSHLGSRSWKISKCTYENRVGTLLRRVQRGRY